MSFLRKILMLCLATGLAMALCGCGEEGTAEKAGKEIDKAFDSAKDAVHDATK